MVIYNSPLIEKQPPFQISCKSLNNMNFSFAKLHPSVTIFSRFRVCQVHEACRWEWLACTRSRDNTSEGSHAPWVSQRRSLWNMCLWQLVYIFRAKRPLCASQARFTVPWRVPVRFAVRRQRLQSRTKRRSQRVGPTRESSTIADSSLQVSLEIRFTVPFH